jgi:hypothetical protein
MSKNRSFLLLIALVCGLATMLASQTVAQEQAKSDKVLRHVVIFKFKETSSEEDIAKIEKVFAALPKKIDAIVDFEWGTNNSPEGLDKGFTHCFLVTFNSEKGRAAYLPHKAHQEFVELLKPHMADAMVIDYWASK